MAMTSAEFETLVARLDDQAQRNPGSYKFRVLLLACLGYAYLAAMGVVIVAMIALTLASAVFLKALAIKLAIPMLIFLWVVIRSLWVRLEAPVGRRVTSADAPALFEMIDGLRRRLKAPRFHRVLVTNDFNAAVVQIPRLGLFGWHRNYLLIGLPLMKTLTPAQLEAVLAHEFGHLAGGHARVSNWIYRLRMSWAQLVAALEHNKGWGNFMFLPFFHWYAPYFNAYSFPLARANEYEADRASAAIASPRAAAEALTSVNVVGAYLEEKFWPQVYRQADDAPAPAFAPYARMGDGLRAEIDAATAERWVKGAMAQQTGVNDTHPCLADRLAAIEETPHLAFPAPGDGADALLGPSRERIVAEMDSAWQDDIGAAWEERHQHVQNGRKRLAELEQRLIAEPEPPLDDAFEQARLTETFGADADAALEQFRRLHAREPDSPVFMYALGQRLLGRDDAEGVSLVERAMQLDPDAIEPGCTVLRDYHWRAGRKEEAHAFHTRLSERSELLAKAQAERDEVTLRDTFDAHGLDASAVATLRAQLQSVDGLKRGYLVRKRLQHLPEQPHYVLGFTVTGWRHDKARALAVRDAILAEVSLPDGTVVFNAQANNQKFASKLARVKDARLV